MVSKVLRNAGLTLLGQVLPAAAAVFVMPRLRVNLGLNRFGFLALSWALLGYFQQLDFGMGRALTHLVARHGHRSRVRLQKTLISTILLELAIGAGFGAVMLGLGQRGLGLLLKNTSFLTREYLGAIHALAYSIPLFAIASSFRAILEGKQLFGRLMLVRSPLLASFFIVPWYTSTLGWGLDKQMDAVLVAVALYAVALGLLSYPLVGLPADYTEVFHDTPFLIRFGGWVTVSTFIGPSLLYAERFILGSLRGLRAVPFYTVPYDAITRLTVLPGSLAAALFPAVGSLREQHSSLKELDDAFRILGTLSIAVMLIGLVTVVLYGRELLGVWMGPEFAARSWAVACIVMIGVIVNGCGHIYFSLIQGSGRPDVTGKLHIVELIVYLPLAYGCVAWWGITGAAIAWTSRVSLDTALLAVASQRIGAVRLRALRDVLKASLLVCLVPGAFVAPTWLLVRHSSVAVQMFGHGLAVCTGFGITYGLFRHGGPASRTWYSRSS